MKKLISLLGVLFFLFVQSNTGQAGNNLSVSYTHVNITQSMDVMVKSNSLHYLYAQEPIANDTIDTKANGPEPGKLKSPSAALVIALVPGSIVHGAGYFYAGKPTTGLFLFTLEVVGAGLIYAGAISSFSEKAEEGTGKERPGLTFIGLALFGGSWLADIIGSPGAARKHNESITNK